MRKFAMVCAAALSLLAVSQAGAQQCDNQQAPSPANGAKTGLTLQNTTSSQINVLWADFDGVLTHYTTLQPKQTSSFTTYVGHIWFLEAFTPEGAVCLGPIRPVSANACKLTVSLDNEGFGYTQQNCRVE